MATKVKSRPTGKKTVAQRRIQTSSKSTVLPIADTQVKLSLPVLRKWNSILAGLFALQGIAILVLSNARSFPVTTSFTAQDPMQTATQSHPVLGIAMHHLFDINLTYLVAAFLIVSAVAHAVFATVYRSRYEAGLRQNNNWPRWIEYALGTSIMLIVIGVLVGVQDISTLVMLFGLAVIMNLCGWLLESQNLLGQQVNWLSYIVGAIAGATAWFVIGYYLLSGGLYGSNAPAFVYWICGSIFVFFAASAANLVLQYRRKGKWADYFYGDMVFMTLNLVAQSLLAWQMFAGSLRP